MRKSILTLGIAAVLTGVLQHAACPTQLMTSLHRFRNQEN